MNTPLVRNRNQNPKKPVRRNLSKQTENVEVFCRIRPLENPNEPACIKKHSPSVVVMTAVESQRTGQVLKECHYSFTRVFDETTSQESLFEQVGFPLVDDVLHGKNSLLFAYGVTSSGKTHTMNGTNQDKGVLPRCLDCIFNSIMGVQAKKYVFKPDKMNRFDVQSEADAMLERQSRDINPKLMGLKSSKETTRSSSAPDISHISSGGLTKVSNLDMDCFYSVFVSFVEVYNNNVFDLLEELQSDPISGYKPPSTKQVREDTEHNMYVSGVVEVEVTSPEEAFELLVKGQKRRKVAYTVLNAESSRSHSIFTLRVVQGPADPRGEHVLLDKNKLVVSQLSLVDLAGSERIGRTGNAGDRLKEAGNINQSLMALRNCIEVLRENQKTGSDKLVPYRDCKLTHLFKTFFEKKGKVNMVVCVNPRAADYDETVNVMKFAELAQEIQIEKAQAPRMDVGLTPGRRMANLQLKELGKTDRELQDNFMTHVYKSMVYSLGPAFPKLVLVDAYDEVTLPAIVKFLKDRQLTRNTLISDLSAKEDEFRAKLMEMDRELVESRQIISQLQQKLRSREEELQVYTKRFSDQERLNESLNVKVAAYENERQELEREVGEKNWTIVQEKLKNNKLRMDYHAKIKQNEQNYNENIEQAKRKIKEETAIRIKAKQQKLDLVKTIINVPDSDVPETPRSRMNSISRSRAFPSTLEMYNGGRAAEDANRGFKGLTMTPARKRTKSPPPIKPKPMGADKLKRRSKSTDNLWIEHRPQMAADSAGSILQPKMKTLRSVMKLTEKDIRDKDANKYLLTHHGHDSNGEFATKFVKGDIIPTVGGGASVVFTDVEVLKQRSPGTTRKRRSSSSREDVDDSWTDVETRCQVGIEGHAKRPRCSQV